jgi:hypothetical protein
MNERKDMEEVVTETKLAEISRLSTGREIAE